MSAKLLDKPLRRVFLGKGVGIDTYTTLYVK